MTTPKAYPRRFLFGVLVAALLALPLLGCGTLSVGIEATATPAATAVVVATNTSEATAAPTAMTTVAAPATATATPVEPTATTVSSATPVPPTEPAPSATPVPPTAPAPSATPVPPTAAAASGTISQVKVALIALEDNGQSGKAVGCGDSVVLVDRQIAPTQAPLKAALQELFSIRQQFLGESGLYSALYQSTLQVDSAVISGDKATIHLSGQLLLGGVCDDPRASAQITETALQFSSVKQVEVYINGTPLSQALSEK